MLATCLIPKLYRIPTRSLMAHQVRSAFSKVFGSSPHKLGLQQVYDVSHNIAKQELHTLPDGSSKRVLVHRSVRGHAAHPALQSTAYGSLCAAKISLCINLSINIQPSIQQRACPGVRLHQPERQRSAARVCPPHRCLRAMHSVLIAALLVPTGRAPLVPLAPATQTSLSSTAL